MPDSMPVNEETPIRPINPMGCQRPWLNAYCRTFLKARIFVTLLYATLMAELILMESWDKHKNPTHLITRALKTAKGELSKLFVYGTDYPTPDGTCIRDYIHVSDLAEVHIAALNYLAKSDKSTVLNCGNGHGYSVREIIQSAKKITDRFLKSKTLTAGRATLRLLLLITHGKRVLNWTPR
jgi:UDP-glucose 4-epimerase